VNKISFLITKISTDRVFVESIF